jgi:hypothetical protein
MNSNLKKMARKLKIKCVKQPDSGYIEQRKSSIARKDISPMSDRKPTDHSQPSLLSYMQNSSNFQTKPSHLSQKVSQHNHTSVNKQYVTTINPDVYTPFRTPAK